jgi:tripartite-type tricarboxylate transporter receptor subunit TctC
MAHVRKLEFMLLLTAILAAGLVPRPASTQDYPNQAITLICPFAPGGATDAISRILQE